MITMVFVHLIGQLYLQSQTEKSKLASIRSLWYYISNAEKYIRFFFSLFFFFVRHTARLKDKPNISPPNLGNLISFSEQSKLHDFK